MSLLDSAPAETNAAPYSVSELAFALKRTLEDAYGFVRLRGEVSKVTRHSSGHVYLTLKDERACIDGVIWRTSVRTLKAQPRQGLEVVVTGRVTTYPSGSKYQIIIETLEPAGIGALLAELERVKAKLQGEGLFANERKRPLPALPRVIGVVTSPTGAVIRDILHRIRDRWPARVLVWPVVVQGEAAAAQVAAAIKGFNALTPGGAIPRPDVLIVARGGGSVEDLWPFNDEALARAVAAGTIPLISAVGHETDTTLIDFVADRRAPTPTAAAEFATPVWAELRAGLLDLQRRLTRAGSRTLESGRAQLRAARLPRDVLSAPTQRYDLAAGQLGAALERNAAVHERDLVRVSARLTPKLLRQQQAAKAERLAIAAARLGAAFERNAAGHERDLARASARLDSGVLARRQAAKAERLAAVAARLTRCGVRAAEAAVEARRLAGLSLRLDAAAVRRLAAAEGRLSALEQLRRSLDPDRPLALGFARVNRPDGALVRDADALAPGDAVRLTFRGRKTVDATVDGVAHRPRPRARSASTPAAVQGSLF